MRLLHFFKLLNKKTKGDFTVTVIVLLLFTVNIFISVYDYGLLENNPDKPYVIYLLVSTVIHFFVVLGVWLIGSTGYYWLFPFITDTIIPLWEEAGENSPASSKPGGKVSFK